MTRMSRSFAVHVGHVTGIASGTHLVRARDMRSAVVLLLLVLGSRLAIAEPARPSPFTVTAGLASR